MSYSISTLLTRSLHDVFGENDPARWHGPIDEIFAENCVFYDPKGDVYSPDSVFQAVSASADGISATAASEVSRRNVKVS
jgi:hypothetical protein